MECKKIGMDGRLCVAGWGEVWGVCISGVERGGLSSVGVFDGLG